MTSTIIKIALVPFLIVVLTLFGNVINDYLIVDILTQFFVFFRTVTKPLAFFWDFDTSFQLLTWVLNILFLYMFLYIFFVIRNITSKD